jgi:hypothetical protein
MTEVLRGTGIRILLREEMPAGLNLPVDEPRERPTPEERVEAAAYDRGELIHVGWHVFADLEDDGRRVRVGGSWGWERPIKLDEDPTSALNEIVEGERYHLGDLLGDLRIGDMDVTRWEFYAAPFKVELSPKLQERLAGTWREHPPRQPPSNEDFYEP